MRTFNVARVSRIAAVPKQAPAMRTLLVSRFATAPKHITPNVKYDTLAREWRFKWSPENDKASLSGAQTILEKFVSKIHSVKGVKKVQRIVCGGCHDFKVIVSLDGSEFGAWDAAKFEPEAEFLAAIGKVPGLSKIETQTYTIADI
jgi:hypothetical protein